MSVLRLVYRGDILSILDNINQEDLMQRISGIVEQYKEMFQGMLETAMSYFQGGGEVQTLEKGASANELFDSFHTKGEKGEGASLGISELMNLKATFKDDPSYSHVDPDQAQKAFFDAYKENGKGVDREEFLAIAKQFQVGMSDQSVASVGADQVQGAAVESEVSSGRAA